MVGLLSLCIYTLFSLFNPMLIAAIPQDSEPNSGSTQAILSILRAHGQASQDTYCYACRWAGQLGYQELPSDLARDFEQIGPDFIRFYRHVRSQLSPALNQYGGTIPENQRGPECTNLLQPFLDELLSFVGEQIQTGEIEVEGRVTDENLAAAFEQFRADSGTEGNPRYNCNNRLESDIFESANLIEAQFNQVGII